MQSILENLSIVSALGIIVIFIIFICIILITWALVRIESHFKDLLDLQFNIYKENNNGEH